MLDKQQFGKIVVSNTNLIISLGGISLSVNPTIDMLGLSNTDTSAGYRAMKRLEFKGNLIEFACWLAVNHLTVVAVNNSPEGEKRTERFLMSFKTRLYLMGQEYARCIMRIFFANPDIIFENEAYQQLKTEECDLKLYSFLCELRFDDYRAEKLGKRLWDLDKYYGKSIRDIVLSDT